MSIHLMVVAAYLPKEVVNVTQKIVLMKIADSADDQTRVGRPGLERMMAWSNVGEKRVSAVVTELVELGLVERVTVGSVGRRAEYKVFPLGVPPIPSTEELAERRGAARLAPKNPRLARTGVKRPKPSSAARTHEDVAARKASRAATAVAREEGFPQGNPAAEGERVPEGEPTGFPGGGETGSPGGTPSLPHSSSSLPVPPTPSDNPAGETDTIEHRRSVGCPRHETPVANCRGCGTNPRAGRERARHQAEAAEHQDQQAWLRNFLDEGQRRLAEADPQAVAEAKARARELARRRPGTSKSPGP